MKKDDIVHHDLFDVDRDLRTSSDDRGLGFGKHLKSGQFPPRLYLLGDAEDAIGEHHSQEESVLPVARDDDEDEQNDHDRVDRCEDIRPDDLSQSSAWRVRGRVDLPRRFALLNLVVGQSEVIIESTVRVVQRRWISDAANPAGVCNTRVMGIDYASLMKRDQVHASLLTDPEAFAEEMERIFVQGWAFVAHESEIREPGDWVTAELGTEAVIAVRDHDGGVNILANRCAHRGTALCWEHKGNDSSLRCTYHAWNFDLDGSVKAIPFPSGYEDPLASVNRDEFALDRAGQVESYRGFVFANLSGTAGPLKNHLGPAGFALIDRLCELSPTGEIDLSAGWVRHRVQSNWKLWPESDSDGYHVGFVHASMASTTDSYYDDVAIGGDAVSSSRAVDWGKGHIELDFRPSYKAELAWLGTTRDKVSGYCEALEARVGEPRAAELLWNGPPHAFLFPNLFLGEMVVAVVDPVAPREMVHRHTAVQFEGVEESFNRRLLRQTEAAVGPASFITSDDAITAERIQTGVGGTRSSWAGDDRGWIDLSRGLHREVVDADGTRSGDLSDETTNRGFWRRYAEVMAERAPV
ncbi:MAG: phenylpropionate dioxygenase-like ring-hydroxylating dioxygenase large terminal subunit [Acidimicrobiales bacterium]